MIDQDLARLWVEHHDAFGHWVDDVAKSIGNAFKALNRIQYDRPWETVSRGRARRGARH